MDILMPGKVGVANPKENQEVVTRENIFNKPSF